MEVFFEEYLQESEISLWTNSFGGFAEKGHQITRNLLKMADMWGYLAEMRGVFFLTNKKRYSTFG
ncbi:MAG: hypothetical protein R3E32_11285 [Chitinophagales bacterium]